MTTANLDRAFKEANTKRNATGKLFHNLNEQPRNQALRGKAIRMLPTVYNCTEGQVEAIISEWDQDQEWHHHQIRDRMIRLGLIHDRHWVEGANVRESYFLNRKV
jgi:hypothetical protein